MTTANLSAKFVDIYLPLTQSLMYQGVPIANIKDADELKAIITGCEIFDTSRARFRGVRLDDMSITELQACCVFKIKMDSFMRCFKINEKKCQHSISAGNRHSNLWLFFLAIMFGLFGLMKILEIWFF